MLTLLDGEGHLRLSDFGISVELSMANNMRTRGRAGTRGYQAPELFDNQTYGFSCDIFSFGVTIYELLHGTRPFNSKVMTPIIDLFISSQSRINLIHVCYVMNMRRK
jgi:serine/threonine protein kinase